MCAAPAQMLLPLRQNAGSPGNNVLAAEAVKDCLSELIAIAADGVRHVEIVDKSWGQLCGIGLSKTWGAGMVDTLQCQDQYLDVNNRVLRSIPPEMDVTFYAPNDSGCYEVVAEKLFSHENVKTYKLDLDATRPECFEALRYVPDGCRVVVKIKNGDKSEIEEAVKEMSCRLPFDRFMISAEDEEMMCIVDSVVKSYWKETGQADAPWCVPTID